MDDEKKTRMTLLVLTEEYSSFNTLTPMLQNVHFDFSYLNYLDLEMKKAKLSIPADYLPFATC